MGRLPRSALIFGTYIKSPIGVKNGAIGREVATTGTDEFILPVYAPAPDA